MALAHHEVKKIFELAKLEGSEEFITSATESLDRIFSLVAKINEIDTTNIEPLAHPNNATQRLREDVANPHIPRETLQNIAPEVESGLYLVPAVIE